MGINLNNKITMIIRMLFAVTLFQQGMADCIDWPTSISEVRWRALNG
jgi:hypothetical protein